MSWTLEREEKLRELWKKGHSASQIASMLGDTTRNAIIGKAHRLNLEARAVSKKSKSKVNTEIVSDQKSKFKSLEERRDSRLYYLIKISNKKIQKNLKN